MKKELIAKLKIIESLAGHLRTYHGYSLEANEIMDKLMSIRSPYLNQLEAIHKRNRRSS